MKDSEIIEILTEDIEEEILDKMPEWFKVLRTYYSKRKRAAVNYLVSTS